MFCQLQRQRFDGVLRVQSAARAAAVGFRAGCPVTLDDATQGHTLGDQLVERGQLTRAQCNTVIARVTEGLVEDEALAFCEHAVALGYMSEDDARLELTERIRTRLIQLFSWTDCRVELEPGEAALDGRLELPQELGAIVYMGVRTFYEDEYIAERVPDLSRTYLRLLAAPASISHFFGLDDDEFQLLRKIDPDTPVASLLDRRGFDRSHLSSLVLLLALAELGELSSAPHSQQQEPERSGARPAPQRPAREQSPQQAASPQDPFDSLSLSGTPLEAAPLDAAIGRRISRPVDATQEALLEAAARTARNRKSSSAVRRMPQSAHDSPPPAAAAPFEAPPRAASLPAAAQRARGPERVSTPSAPRSTSGSAPSMPAAGRPSAASGPLLSGAPESRSSGAPGQAPTDYAKAHLEELIKRRKHNAPAPEAAAPSGKREPARDLRHARDLLRDQHYARAAEVLHELLEKEPESEVLRTYHAWARFRAQPDASDTLGPELRELAKKLVHDSEHVAFAAYALGHVYFSAKRDDLAEKFFKRAHAADRNNKDAERHVLILERRKREAAEQAAAANRKIFGIQISNAKPKP